MDSVWKLHGWRFHRILYFSLFQFQLQIFDLLSLVFIVFPEDEILIDDSVMLFRKHFGDCARLLFHELDSLPKDARFDVPDNRVVGHLNLTCPLLQLRLKWYFVGRRHGVQALSARIAIFGTTLLNTAKEGAILRDSRIHHIRGLTSHPFPLNVIARPSRPITHHNPPMVVSFHRILMFTFDLSALVVVLLFLLIWQFINLIIWFKGWIAAAAAIVDNFRLVDDLGGLDF